MRLSVVYLTVLYYSCIVCTAKFATIDNPLVTTWNGLLRGFRMHTVSSRAIDAFQGIPYAQPPVGKLRFRDPIKNKPWIGKRDAIALPPPCVQVDAVQDYAVIGQEDCLYLNIYRPATSSPVSKKLPVIFWIHGGAFLFGSGGIYGPAYLLDHDVILVTINYRLGPFGFLSTGDSASPGNQGLKDQAMALQWVRDNIRFFGGDCHSITVVGQSAGGVSAHLLAISPLTRNLFQRGISQSGTAMAPWAVSKVAPSITRAVANTYNCSSPTNSSIEIVDCLRNIDAKKLVQFGGVTIVPVLNFPPVVEHKYPGAFLTEMPVDAYRNRRVANLPWIFGVTGTELARYTSLFFLHPEVVDYVNQNWATTGVSILGLGAYSPQSAEICEKVWDFYMGQNGTLDWESRFNFSNMWSDRNMFFPMVDAIRYHSKFTKEKVFGYQMTYQGSRSISTLLGYKAEDWGPVHLDDLIYLFNNTEYFGDALKPNDTDFEMVEKMTGYWVEFATTGKVSRKFWSTVKSNGYDRVEELRFLDLTENSIMMGNPFQERESFWRGLNLSSDVPPLNIYTHHWCHRDDRGSDDDNIICSLLKPRGHHHDDERNEQSEGNNRKVRSDRQTGTVKV